MTNTNDRRNQTLDPGDKLALRAASRRTLHFLQSVACSRHHALIGEPCWILPAAFGTGEITGTCSRRLAAARAAQTAAREGRALPGSRRRGRGGRRA